jgi:hypothetical protein
MAKAAKAISSRIVAVVVIAMMVVVGLGVVESGVLNSGHSTTASTSSSSSGTTTITTVSSTGSNSSATLSSSTGLNQTFEASNSTLGLELLLSVNSTTIPSEDAISISASVVNTLPTSNNLTASDDWAIQGLSSGSCDPQGNSTDKLFDPVGMTVFRGSYGLQNLSDAGRPLFVWAIVSCPADFVFVGNQTYIQTNVTSFSLLPGSDNGTYAGFYGVPGPQPPPVCNSGICTYPPNSETYAKGVFPTRMISGGAIYAANGTGFYNSLGSALPSNYTLVAGDEWGQIVLAHFEVTASGNLPKVGNFLSSTGGCSPGPCLGQRFSDALIFNCAAAAATPVGCSAIYSEGVRYSAAPPVNYTVTVWYPSYGQPDEPASANCMYNVSPVGALVKPPTPTLFGYCLMINSTAFVVSLPQP